MARKFRIGLARDFFTLRSEVRRDLGLRRLDNEMRRDLGLRRLDDEPRATCELFPQYLPEITPEQIAGYDVLILGGPSCTRHTVSGPELKLSIVARLGVGCDNVDLAALTERDILLTITPEGIRQPMATATVTFILALAHELFAMDRLVREGRWIEKLKVQRRSLTGRVVGRCCTNWFGRGLALRRLSLLSDDSAGLRLAQLGHPVQYVTPHHRLSLLRFVGARPKAVSEHALIPQEEILDAGLSPIP